MFKADDPTYVRTEVRRRLNDRTLTQIIFSALDLGAPARLTKSGIVFAGQEGTATTHWTNSDWRASKNLEAELRRIGWDLPRQQSGTPGQSSRRKKKVERFTPLPKQYEVDTRTTSYTWRPEPEPEPVPEPTPRVTRDVGARARALSLRKIPPRLAALYPRLSDELRKVSPELLLDALRVADDDPRRVTVHSDGSLMVWNRPRW